MSESRIYAPGAVWQMGDTVLVGGKVFLVTQRDDYDYVIVPHGFARTLIYGCLHWMEPRVAYLRRRGRTLASAIGQRALWGVAGLEVGAQLVLWVLQ